MKNNKIGYLFISPYVFGILAFSVFPILFNIYLSLTNKKFIGSSEYIGLTNFTNLFNDNFFISSLRTTLLFALFATSLLTVIPLMIALLIHDNFPGRQFFRSLYFMPIIMSAPAIAAIFIFIYDRDYGLLNQFLGLLGKAAWLGNEALAVPSLVILAVWHQTPVNFVLYVAALQDVPEDIIEASVIDGAGLIKKIFYIVLPTITPTIFLILVTTVTFQMQQFAYPAILNGGRFGTATLSYYIYQTGFEFGKFGYSSAMSLFFSLIIFAIMLVQWNMKKKWVHYNS